MIVKSVLNKLFALIIAGTMALLLKGPSSRDDGFVGIALLVIYSFAFFKVFSDLIGGIEQTILSQKENGNPLNPLQEFVSNLTGEGRFIGPAMASGLLSMILMICTEMLINKEFSVPFLGPILGVICIFVALDADLSFYRQMRGKLKRDQ